MKSKIKIEKIIIKRGAFHRYANVEPGTLILEEGQFRLRTDDESYREIFDTLPTRSRTTSVYIGEAFAEIVDTDYYNVIEKLIPAAKIAFNTMAVSSEGCEFKELEPYEFFLSENGKLYIKNFADSAIEAKTGKWKLFGKEVLVRKCDVEIVIKDEIPLYKENLIGFVDAATLKEEAEENNIHINSIEERY